MLQVASLNYDVIFKKAFSKQQQELRIDKGCTMCISKILPVLKLHYDKGNKPSFNCKLYTSIGVTH
jgi:hypothetical protein